MTYHIKKIINKSDRAAVLSNQGNADRDTRYVAAGGTVTYDSHPVLVNKQSGNPTYNSLINKVPNIYTKRDNYFMWDNTNSAIEWLGQGEQTAHSLNLNGAELTLTVEASGELTFAYFK